MNDVDSMKQILADLDQIRCMIIIQRDRMWYAPDCAQRIEKSRSDLERIREEVSKVPFLLEHGATTKASSILRTAKKHRNRARNRLLRNDHEEEVYRLLMVKRIHDS